MHIVVNDREFDIDDTTALLPALQQRGIAASFSCRNGNCGLCEASLNAGRVWLDDKRQFVDAPATVLLCRAFARSDLVLGINIMPRTVSRYCRVLSVERIADGYQVELQLPAGRTPSLLPDATVSLEGGSSARPLTPLAIAGASPQRSLRLRLHDDDTEWLEAIVARDGVRIVLLVAVPSADSPSQ